MERRVKIRKQEGHNFLWSRENGRPLLWMWDLPEEREAQKQIAEQAFGDVLVAGYGLGLVQELLIENPNVSSVTTVEISPEVLAANQKAGRGLNGEIVVGDFLSYESDILYDCVVGDIWIDITPRDEDLLTYKKFKEKALSMLKPGGKVLAWGMGYFEYVIHEHPTSEVLNSLTKDGD